MCAEHLIDVMLSYSFLLTVNSCSDYACTADKEKCNPQCHTAVISGLR